MRVSTHSPDFAFKDFRITFGWHVAEAEKRDIVLRWREAKEGSSYGEGNKSIALECYNVGLGAAKRVHITWRLDIAEFVFVIHELDKEGEFSIFDEGRGEVSINVAGEYPSHVHYTAHQFKALKPYVLPISVTLVPEYITIPSIWWFLTSIYLYLVASIYNEDSRYFSRLNIGNVDLSRFKQPSRLYLNVAYLDIAEMAHEKKYAVSFEIGQLAAPPGVDGFEPGRGVIAIESV